VTEIRFTPTPDDLIAAQRLHQRTALPRYLTWFGAVGVIAGILFWYLSDGDAVFLVTVVITYPLAIILPPVIARFWTIPRMARKAQKHDRALNEECRFSWSEKSAKAESASGGWDQPLSDFACWKANDDVLLLYRQTNLFHFFPTHAFPDDAARASLIAALKANGVSNHWPPK
jgi:hypothetical protein